MKKVLYLSLVLILTLSLIVGCGKKDKGEALPDGNGKEIVEENGSSKESPEEKVPDEIDYILYLRYRDKPFLYDDLFTVKIDDERIKNKTIEEFVINELIAYSGQGGLISPMPKGTKVLGVTREDTTVIVDLSKEFIYGNLSNSDALLTLGGLVNTITVLPGNEKVAIYVEGKPLEKFHGIDTSQPLSFFDGLFADK